MIRSVIRVVLDTNVLVSVAIPGSHLQALVDSWQQGDTRLLLSEAIFDEYLRVLTYPKFQLTTEDIRRILERELLPYTEFVKVTSAIRVIKEDPSDNKFLACAVDGKADWIITGDRHLLKLGTFRRVKIVTPAEFLKTLRKR